MSHNARVRCRCNSSKTANELLNPSLEGTSANLDELLAQVVRNGTRALFTLGEGGVIIRHRSDLRLDGNGVVTNSYPAEVAFYCRPPEPLKIRDDSCVSVCRL